MKEGQKVRVTGRTRYGHKLEVGTIANVVEVGDGWVAVRGKSARDGKLLRQTLDPCDLEVLDETTKLPIQVRIVDCMRYGHNLKIGSVGDVIQVRDSERWLVLGESNYSEDAITQTVHPCDLVVLDDTQPNYKDTIDNLIETFKASDYTELEIIAYLEGYKAGCEASERE